MPGTTEIWRIIDAKVPLAEMFGYSSEIRGITAGRGSFTMEPLSYERVPEQIAKEICKNADFFAFFEEFFLTV